MFDSVENERDIGLQISRWENEGKVRMIEKGDKFEAVKSQLLKIKQALETLNKLGINRDVMETYIYSKSKCVKEEKNTIIAIAGTYMSNDDLKLFKEDIKKELGE